MKQLFTFLLMVSALFFNTGFAQTSEIQKPSFKIDEEKFFSEEKPFDVTIIMDMKSLYNKKLKEGHVFQANFKCKLFDSIEVNEPINIVVRGKYRRENCFMPPLRLKFKGAQSPTLSPLGSLKLVNPCQLQKAENEYLLKEYLVYKIYNTLTEKSFRVRLLNITYEDSEGKKKPVTQNAFLIEDVDDMAKRNNCLERERNIIHTEATDRKQMTLVAMFEYMIGNTDWQVPLKHNIKLIAPKEDTMTTPYAVPYDFDHAGFVNTYYALPNENLPITSVRQRFYKGFARTKDEIEEAITVFNQQKENIYSVIQNFELLSPSTRKELIDYLEDFYVLLKNPNGVKTAFIENVRTN